MTTLTNDQLNDAADQLFNTRVFCGDERESFIDWCADNGLRPTKSAFSYVLFEVNRRWRKFQIEAGVKQPIYQLTISPHVLTYDFLTLTTGDFYVIL